MAEGWFSALERNDETGFGISDTTRKRWESNPDVILKYRNLGGGMGPFIYGEDLWDMAINMSTLRDRVILSSLSSEEILVLMGSERPPDFDIALFTPSEKKILSLYQEGLSPDEIASNLKLANKLVKSTLTRVQKILDNQNEYIDLISSIDEIFEEMAYHNVMLKMLRDKRKVTEMKMAEFFK